MSKYRIKGKFVSFKTYAKEVGTDFAETLQLTKKEKQSLNGLKNYERNLKNLNRFPDGKLMNKVTSKDVDIFTKEMSKQEKLIYIRENAKAIKKRMETNTSNVTKGQDEVNSFLKKYAAANIFINGKSLFELYGSNGKLKLLQFIDRVNKIFVSLNYFNSELSFSVNLSTKKLFINDNLFDKIDLNDDELFDYINDDYDIEEEYTENKSFKAYQSSRLELKAELEKQKANPKTRNKTKIKRLQKEVNAKNKAVEVQNQQKAVQKLKDRGIIK
jgi:hypothetical protein